MTQGNKTDKLISSQQSWLQNKEQVVKITTYKKPQHYIQFMQQKSEIFTFLTREALME